MRLARALPLRVLALALALLWPALRCQAAEVVLLTDANFDDLTASGTWLIDIYAPWCPHCKELDPIWAQLSKDLDGRVHIAKVDGPANRVLLQRFGVAAYPSIFHLAAGETREYAGARRADALAEWATGGFRDTPPRPAHRAPNSQAGRIVGRLLSLPARVQRFYRHMHHERRVPSLALLAGSVAVPIAAGTIIICALDAYYTRAARRGQQRAQHPPQAVAHVHHE